MSPTTPVHAVPRKPPENFERTGGAASAGYAVLFLSALFQIPLFSTPWVRP